MLQVAIIGLGSISHRVAKGVQFAKNANLYAVASRNMEKATAFQKQYDAQVAYGSYEEVVSDENVDLVYICTPNYLHYDHIMLCLKHQKHVLCEKPFVTNEEQLTECFAYAKQQHCFLMEAEKTLFTPLNQKIKQMVEEGVIGELQYIEGSYGYYLDEHDVPKDFWGYRKEDGGCSYDVGVYPICYANYFADAPLHKIQVMKQCDDKGYDVFMQALLEYENGRRASVRSAWNMDMCNKGFLYGTQGYIETENFWKNTTATLVLNGERTPISVTMESDFTGEIEHAASCIEQNMIESYIISEKNSLEIMKVLKEVKK